MLNKKIKRVVVQIIAIIIGIIVVFPFLAIIFYSTKGYLDIISDIPPKLQFRWTTIVKNYKEILFGRGAAYGLSRFKFKNHSFLTTWILSNRFLPPVAFVIPIFLMIKTLRLLDTFAGLLIPYVAFSLPFIIWIMIGFFDEIPVEIDESAMVDGASRIGAFLRVVLPISGPGLVATSIFTIIFTWHEFLVGLFITMTKRTQTAPIGGAGLLTIESPLAHNLTAGVGVVTIMPIILIAFVLSKYVVRGMTLGAVKQ
jgi:multiple sugar transport system permease protein